MAKIRDEDIDALRERADIVEVASSYTQLKKAGGRTFKGLCPFHSEKTPSFTVDAARNLFHCFGCQEGGDVYGFVQKMESLSFPEAAEWLARKFGFELHYEEGRPGEERAKGLKLRIIEANEAAAAFFHKALMESPAAEQARRYLGNRGFGKDVAGKWQLGFAPGGSALTKHLLSRGFTNEQLLKGDLARTSERDGALYDTFRGRIIFPTWDRQGNLVGFGARALGDQQPKYLNTSETPAFSKSKIMYGLHRAKSSIARGEYAIVVEGYTDVIALHQAGIEQAVATNGVALGESHFELLKKFTERVVLMFDSDVAGAGATERGFALQHRIGLEVLVAPLPPDRDPADVVVEDGPDGINKAIAAARPLLEFKLEQTIAVLPLDTPEARSRAVREVVTVLGWHPDPIARHEYGFIAAQRIGVDVQAVQRAIGEGAAASTGPSDGPSEVRDRRYPGHVKVEREALRLLLTRADEASRSVEGIAEAEFTSPARRELFGVATSGKDLSSIIDELSPDARSLYTELTVGADFYGESVPGRANEVFTRLRIFGLEREIKRRRNTLQEINPLIDPKRHDLLFTELVKLEAERRDLLRSIQGAA